MYYLLSLLAGMLISTMVVFNGELNTHVGQIAALVIIHAVGLVFVTVLLLIKKEKPKLKRLPFYLYIGGYIGIVTIVFNNIAFGHISVSAMMSLGLLGESISSLLADHFGVLGFPKRLFRKQKLWGALLSLVGIIWMWDDFQLIPVLISLGAGVMVLLSRLINGQLARKTRLLTSTFINFLTGLSGALSLLLFVGSPTPLANAFTGRFYIYLGGLLGGIIVLLSSFCVGKIPSFYMTLALFVGQVFAGLLLDMLLTGQFPLRNFIGGFFVLAGLMLNLYIDRKYENRRALIPMPH
ncbi:MAG: DMT family transporter [Clostridiales bacterium]|nr:DMT family transporter [Clostridiales bacterium]